MNEPVTWLQLMVFIWAMIFVAFIGSYVSKRYHTKKTKNEKEIKSEDR